RREARSNALWIFSSVRWRTTLTIRWPLRKRPSGLLRKADWIGLQRSRRKGWCSTPTPRVLPSWLAASSQGNAKLTSRRDTTNVRPHVDALLPGHGRRAAGQCPKCGWGEIIPRENEACRRVLACDRARGGRNIFVVEV